MRVCIPRLLRPPLYARLGGCVQAYSRLLVQPTCCSSSCVQVLTRAVMPKGEVLDTPRGWALQRHPPGVRATPLLVHVGIAARRANIAWV